MHTAHIFDACPEVRFQDQLSSSTFVSCDNRNKVSSKTDPCTGFGKSRLNVHKNNRWMRSLYDGLMSRFSALCLLCTQTHVLWVHTDSGPAAEDGRAIIEGSAVLIRLLSGLQRRPSGAERDPQSAGSCYNRRNSAGRFRWREQ